MQPKKVIALKIERDTIYLDQTIRQGEVKKSGEGAFGLESVGKRRRRLFPCWATFRLPIRIDSMSLDEMTGDCEKGIVLHMSSLQGKENREKRKSANTPNHQST